MKHPSVLILGYSEAGMHLRTPDAANIDAIITVYGQREYPVEAPHVNKILALRFDDAEAPSTTDPIQVARVRLRQRQAAELGLTFRPPSIKDAESVVGFARSVRDVSGVLLCQCQGGISRSPAVALLCLATWTGPGHERACAEQVLRVRPSALPHLDLVRFGDQLLGRSGALTEALECLRPG